MTHVIYLVSLLIALLGLGVLDRRYTLALWKDRKRTFVTVGISFLVFLVWDFFGIGLGIFYHGTSAFSLPFTILPQFPIEEILFLVLLCYCTLIVYQGVRQRWSRI